MPMELSNAFLERLGVTLTEWRDDFVKMELLLSNEHSNRTGIAQGGVIATLLDAACGYAGLFSLDKNRPEHSTTITLSINFVAPAEILSTITAVGEVTGKGKNIYYSTGRIYSSTGIVIATAQGAFKRRN